MISRIHAIVNSLRSKYGTSDPFELIDALGINLGYTGASRLKGYYVVQNRERFIRINSNLSVRDQYGVASHELGHDRLHQEIARVYPLRDISLFSMKSKCEHQANLFAAELLVMDQDVLDCMADEMDYMAMCRTLEIDPDLMAFKVYSMLQRGHRVNVPQNINSGFLKIWK